MKQLYTFLFLLCTNFTATSQNAVINEFSADPSMYDGGGGEFIELYCPIGGGACNISCWVVSDGQGLITIPDGTTIPEGGFYLIAHAPSFNCDSCDFFGVPINLNTATCNCLNGGSYGTGVGGTPAMILGRLGNAGELMLLYNNIGALVESWSFDNGSSAYLPTGGTINGTTVGSCPPVSTAIPPADSSVITDVGGIVLGCNTSYLRDNDGSATWTTNNHPTPGGTNANMGNNAFDFQYSIDGGAWTSIPKDGTDNISNFQDTLCEGDSIAFRVIIENYQHAILTIFDSTGRYGSYFKSPIGGIMNWATVSGLGATMGGILQFTSNNEPINLGTNAFTLQWSDYKDGEGSFIATSSNECYERMNVTILRNPFVDSATIICTDPLSGISVATAYPLGVDGYGSDIEYVLYDDAGNLSNPIDSNEAGVFQLSTPPVTGYYVQVQGLCNNVIATDLGAFCTAIPPCPQITSSSFVKNGAICGPVVGPIFTENFESGSGGFVTSTPQCATASPSADYFILTNGSNLSATYLGATGSYFAGQDIDNAVCPAAPGANATITWTGINIAGATGLQLSMSAAEDDAADGLEDWDIPDFFHLDISIDGGAFVPAIWFEGTNTNTVPRLDTDFNGTGDGTVLTGTFQNFIRAIAGTGTTMTIRATFQMESGDEDIAIDNLVLTGLFADTCQACPTDTLTFSVDGTNLPMGGTIDWYYSTTDNFFPYNGEGTFIGSTPIPTPDVCSSPTLVINEFIYRPAFNNGVDPNTGEVIELLGPPGMNIGCFVITDGDWTVTIPPGTVIPPDGIFTLGNNAVYGAGTFDLDVEACGCYTEVGGQLLILTDGGEYFGVYDAAGTFVQGVIYGAPTAGNLPPNGTGSVGGIINTVGLAGCPGAINISAAGYETTPTTATGGTSIIRNPDGTGPWTTQAGGSVNACNVPSIIPPMPDFDYGIPLDACDETRVYKGIINPHPNTVACPNTAPSAFTDEFVIRVVCPDATLQGDYVVCAADLPLFIPIGTTDIADGVSTSLVYTNNGTPDTLTGTVTNDTMMFSPTTTGTYTGLQIIPSTGCMGPADSTATVTIVPTPPAPSLPSPMSVCEGDTALISPSGASIYEWSLTSNFSSVDTLAEYLIAAPDSIYVRAINQDDSLTVSCRGASSAAAVGTIVCNIVILGQDLLAFDAHKIGKKALLEWQWQANRTADNFYIERSRDAIQFEVLATVPTISNPNYQLQYYQTIDSHPINGWNYYRLKYPTSTGYQYSQVRTLNFGENIAPITVFPSPTKGMITIGFAELLAVGASIKVYDILGQEVLTGTIPKMVRSYDLDLSDLPAAAYVIAVETGIATQNIRIIKQ